MAQPCHKHGLAADLDAISPKVPKTNLKPDLSLSDSVRLRSELKICLWHPFWVAQVPLIIVGRRVPESPLEDNFEASRLLRARRVPSGSWWALRWTFQLALGIRLASRYPIQVEK